ncbi:MAG: hypothetical protein ACRDTF_12135 [Pseudonocardiaceae bacterium]
MSEAALDLELVVSADRAVTIPPSELARLSAAVPGQRVRVRIEKAPATRRTLLGAFVKPGRATLTMTDFDAISDELWAGSGYGRD